MRVLNNQYTTNTMKTVLAALLFFFACFVFKNTYLQTVNSQNNLPAVAEPSSSEVKQMPPKTAACNGIPLLIKAPEFGLFVVTHQGATDETGFCPVTVRLSSDDWGLLETRMATKVPRSLIKLIQGKKTADFFGVPMVKAADTWTPTTWEEFNEAMQKQ